MGERVTEGRVSDLDLLFPSALVLFIHLFQGCHVLQMLS